MESMAKKTKLVTDKPKRRGRLVSARLNDADLEGAYELFMASQRVRPNDSDVVVLSLQEFLIREGFYRPRTQENTK
jgi:hypothetical protein